VWTIVFVVAGVGLIRLISALWRESGTR
jgi:hypothetical protein